METRQSQGPALVFVGVALVYGVLFVILTPPMQVSDEGAHFLRAYQLSTGRIIATRLPHGEGKFASVSVTGGELPIGVIELVDTYEPMIFEWFPKPGKLLEQSAQFKIVPAEARFQHFSNTAIHSPLPYVPQALGIACARLFSDKVLVCFYAGRAANLVAAIVCVFLAIRIAPVFDWALVFCALTPMAVYQMASQSADAMTNALCFLFVAWVLRCAFGTETCLGIRNCLGFFLLAAAVGLVKQFYYPLVLLYLLIPVAKVGSRSRYWLMFAGLLLTTGLCVAGWALVVRSIYSPAGEWVDAKGQLQFVTQNPAHFTKILLRNLFDPELQSMRFSQFIGWLGHMKLSFPTWFVAVHGCVLLLVACFDLSPNLVALDIGRRLLCLAVWLIIYLLICVTIYLTWMHIGEETVLMQGRYFVPTAPVLLFSLYRVRGIRPALTKRGAALLPYFASLFLPLSLAYSTYALYAHFYLNQWLP